MKVAIAVVAFLACIVLLISSVGDYFADRFDRATFFLVAAFLARQSAIDVLEDKEQKR